MTYTLRAVVGVALIVRHFRFSTEGRGVRFTLFSGKTPIRTPGGDAGRKRRDKLDSEQFYNRENLRDRNRNNATV